MDKFTEKAKLLNDEDLIIRIGNLGRGDDYDGNFTNTGLNEFRAYQNVAIDRLDELRKEIATLTEQLRLANEDAERLYEMLKSREWSNPDEYGDGRCISCYGKRDEHDNDCFLHDTLRLHEQLRKQE